MMINKRLLDLCEDSKRYIMLTVLVNWIATICNIVMIIFIGGFINRLYLGERVYISSGIFYGLNSFKIWGISLSVVLIIIGGLLCVRFTCNLLYTRFSNLASSNARIKLRKLIYIKLLKLGTRYTEVERTSAVVQVMVEGIEQLEVYFGRYLPQLFYALLVPFTLFIFMSFISIKAALVFILCVPLIPISIIVIMKIAKRILKEYWKSYSDLGGTFLENLQGLTTLKVFNIDEERQEKMNKEAEGFRKITMKVLSMQLNSITVMDLVAFLGACIGTIVGITQFMRGEILMGDLIIIVLLSSEFFIPLRLLGSYFHIAMNGMAASDRIFGILDAKEREKGSIDLIKSKDIGICVRLENVSFSYDEEREILKNINMDIKRKGIVSIVGESGSGKSTVAGLILNNSKVSKGNIYINDMTIEKISLNSIYENIGLVSTNSYIFNGTIIDNLLIGNKKANKMEIKEVLKLVKLEEFVSSLENGVYTNVGEGGNKLSGGQKQRLALARVILSKKEMIIFDEATSNIDVESEECIWEVIYEIAKTKTILVISHRLANIKKADKIYVMKKGQIIESGNHKELMKLKGHYLEMVENQDELEKIREVC
ncbi:MAG: ABC transporter ATP-binding protein/permease [Clostridium sp.]